MKTYLKLLLIALCSIIIADSMSAQRYYPLEYSPDLLLGKWAATNGDMTYEVEFIMDTYVNSRNDESEYVLGRITYKSGRNIVRKTVYNRLRSIIYGVMRSPKQAGLNFCDDDRLVWWEFDFTIDENDSSRAVWKFTKAKGGWMDMGWNETNSPDIPDNLVFQKVVMPTNPGDLDPGTKM